MFKKYDVDKLIHDLKRIARLMGLNREEIQLLKNRITAVENGYELMQEEFDRLHQDITEMTEVDKTAEERIKRVHELSVRKYKGE